MALKTYYIKRLDVIGDIADSDELRSTESGYGASLVSINDSGSYFTSTTVEGALQELGAVAPSGATTLNIGDPTVDGSWRLTVSGSDLSVQRRESGVWNEKGLFTA